jgi:hypothetical protein
MAGKDNLKVPTSEEARINGRKGGKASAEARRRKKTFKEVTNAMLSLKMRQETVDALQSAIMTASDEITADEAIVLAQIIKAAQGDTTAAAWVRDTVGEKPGDSLRVEQDKPFQVNIKVIE